MRIKLFALLAGALLSSMSFAVYAYTPKALLVDGSGNVYVIAAGATLNSDTPANKTTICKYNSSGTLQWTYNYTSDPSVPTCASFDSSGNIIVGGTAKSGSDYFLLKVNTSGTYQWASTQNKSHTETLLDIECDGSGNTYCVGHSWTGSTYASHFFKYNSSGSVQWTKTDSADYADWREVKIDTNGMIVVASIEIASSTPYVNGRQYNTSGTLTDSAGWIDDAFVVHFNVDSAGRYYLTYLKDTGTGSTGFCRNFDDDAFTTLNLGWNKGISTSMVLPNYELVFDSSDNPIVAYSTPGGTSTSVSKFNASNGVTAWTSTYNEDMLHLYADGSGNSYVTSINQAEFYGLVTSGGSVTAYGDATPYRTPTASMVTSSGNVYVASAIYGGTNYPKFFLEGPSISVYGP